jgi:hypothetical protein
MWTGQPPWGSWLARKDSNLRSPDPASGTRNRARSSTSSPNSGAGGGCRVCYEAREANAAARLQVASVAYQLWSAVGQPWRGPMSSPALPLDGSRRAAHPRAAEARPRITPSQRGADSRRISPLVAVGAPRRPVSSASIRDLLTDRTHRAVPLGRTDNGLCNLHGM